MTQEQNGSTLFSTEDKNPMETKRQQPQEKIFRFLLMTAATAVILVVLRMASVIVTPMLMSLFLTIILLVPLRWLQKKGCPKIIALIIVLGCTGIVFLGIGRLVGKSINEFIREFPRYKAKITEKFDAWEKSLNLEQYGFALPGRIYEKKIEENDKQNNNNIPEAKSPLEAPSTAPDSLDGSLHSSLNIGLDSSQGSSDDDENQFIPDHSLLGNQSSLLGNQPSLIELNIETVMYWVGTAVRELRRLVESSFLVMIITIFMIFEAARFPEKVDWALGKSAPINNEHLHNIAIEIRRYLFIKSVACVMSSSAATIVYLYFDVPGAFLWGLVAFFLYFIPNLGGIIAAIIPGLLIFMAQDVQVVLLYIVCLVSIECAIGYGIEPKMLGHGLGISTVVIFLSLLSWGWILGPVGLFLAAPLTIMVKIILQAFKETEWIAILLGDKHQPDQRIKG